MSAIDTHCHLDDTRGEPLDEVIAAAHRAGVTRMITVGCDVAGSRTMIDIARRTPGVYATAGVHPHDAKGGIAGLAELLHDPVVVAVGECGLDYHYDNSPRSTQRDVFAAQIELAHERDLPLVIHSREAWDDTFDILDRHGVPQRAVFHCFTGGRPEAEQCVQRGAYLSFSGIVTFPSATDVHDAARWCPADRLLAETDSPYLAPIPHRGRPNRPAFVVHVAERLAELRQTTVEQIWRAVNGNADAVFARLAADRPRLA